MKLIKKGTRLEKIFSGSCRNCGNEYEAVRSELKIEDGGQRDPGEFAHATCENCKSDIVFYPKRD